MLPDPVVKCWILVMLKVMFYLKKKDVKRIKYVI